MFLTVIFVLTPATPEMEIPTAKLLHHARSENLHIRLRHDGRDNIRIGYAVRNSSTGTRIVRIGRTCNRETI